MKLATKLSLMIAVLVFGIVIMGVFSIYQMGRLNNQSAVISKNWLPSTVLIQNINTMTSDLRIYEVGHAYSEASTILSEYERKMRGIQNSISESIEKYKRLISSEEEKAIFAGFLEEWERYISIRERVINLSNQLKTAEAVALLTGESRQTFDKASERLLEGVNLNVDGGNAASNEGEQLYGSSTTMVVSILIALTLLAAALGVVIVRGTLRTLGKDPGVLMEIAQRVVRGDYNIDDGSPKTGVYGEIVGMVGALEENIAKAMEESERARVESENARQAMRKAETAGTEAQAKTEAMLAAADKLEEVAHIVSSASAELSAQIEQSERGASDQASRVTETATAMEEMNSTVLEVAKNAGTASDVSLLTRQKAEDGAQVVRKAVISIQDVQQQSVRLREDMLKLDENAKDINRIMGVISDIADQTNLLALNAAIEAARAGEAGRGFAVVADEVRKLAEKTMASTTDVGNAIRGIQASVSQSMAQVDSSVQSIEEATDYANQSGLALEEIVRMVDNTADQVRAIATASEQQSASSEEINQSINHVNTIAAETARAMQEASRAVTDLAGQSQVLTRLIADMKS